jgi:hypothetical protein
MLGRHEQGNAVERANAPSMLMNPLVIRNGKHRDKGKTSEKI